MIVSNSSPLILYANTGLLTLLRDVFEEVRIPPAVYREVVVDGAGRPGAEEVRMASWITAQSLLAAPLPLLPAAGLDSGEAEAIVLARQLGEDIPVLFDDAVARRVALGLGIRVFGCAGVLTEAKRRGFVSEVLGPLARLMGAGLYLSRWAYLQVLAAAVEPEGDTRRAP